MTVTSVPRAAPILMRSATELTALLADRLVGARELLAETRAHVETVNPALNAVVTVDWDRAEAEAAAADDAAASGRSLGLLHGLPMTVKDAVETAGMRTTCGSPELRDHVPRRDAPAVARLRRAGAIVYGKTNVPTMAWDCQSTNPVFGTTLNPWDPERTPGGSSGGAAAAVATGMAALELGSDLGGSIRLPAHFCGVYGLKPSFGVVPQVGHIPPMPGRGGEIDMAALGPLARSADDLDLGLAVVAGPAESDAIGWRLALPAPRAERLGDYRIGIWADDPVCPVDSATGTALHRLADDLRAEGVEVVDVSATAPSLGEGLALFRRLAQQLAGLFMSAEELAAMAAVTDKSEWEENVTLSARDLFLARGERAAYAAAWAEQFREVDVVLTPVTPTPAFPHDHEPEVDLRRILVDGRPRPYGEQFAWLQAPTAAHLPGAVAPLTTSGGLPIGVQVIGPHLEDRTVIDVCRRLAAVTGGFRAP